MNRKDYRNLGALLVAGLLVRVLLFRHIGIWGDFGFWTYDARMILEGQTPFVDFLGRSPLFLYIYAGAVWITGERVLTLRWLVILFYLLTAIPLYAIGHKLRGTTTATLATGFYLLLPFGLAYGVRGNSQTLALFCSMCGVAVLLRSERWWAVPYAGLFLALAFLARQSAIAGAAGIGLWLISEGYQRDLEWRVVARRCGQFSVAWLGTVLVAYMAFVGSIGQGIAVFDSQVIGLFVTDGRGGYPMIGKDFPVPESPSMSGPVPVVNAVFPALNARASRVMTNSILAASPVIALCLWWLRDWTDRLFSERLFTYFAGVMATLALYGIFVAVRAGFIVRPLAVAALLVVGVVAWSQSPLERDILYARDTQLVLAVAGMLAFGYLVRDRLLANYYFLDIFPFVCIVAAVVGVAAWERADRSDRILLAGAVVVLVATSGVAAHPLADPMTGNESDWFTVETQQQYQTDINQRTEPGDRVLAGQPTYLAGTHAKMPMHDPRIHYRYSAFTENQTMHWPAEQLYQRIVPAMKNGTYEYAILDPMLARILDTGIDRGLLDGEFRDNFCRVESADELYGQTDAALYRYQSDCRPDRRVTDQQIIGVARG